MFQLVGMLSAAQPAPIPVQRPITEVDVYRDMAKFWELAGTEESLLVNAGGGHIGEPLVSLDVAYRHAGLRGLGELLPTTIGASLWTRPGGGDHTLSASLGYTLVAGLFEGPYVTANVLGLWKPGDSAFGLGADLGLGYEWRANLGWSVTADARSVWTTTDPWGVRVTLGLRHYFGL